jgi:nicotinate-nucleotide adenylyltransferase
MRIGILGLSGDPPHEGHASIGIQALKENLVDEVWVMPCPERPGKVLQSSVQHRLNMCRLTFDDKVNDKYKNFKVSDFQIVKNLKTTIETYEALISEDRIKSVFEGKEPNSFYWIIGKDCADEIKTWKDYERLIKEVKFIVFKRGNSFQEKNFESWYTKKPHFYLWHEEYDTNISSTTIRELFQKNRLDLLRVFCPVKLFEYIVNNKLYLSEEILNENN